MVDNHDKEVVKNRKFLKANKWGEFIETDQKKGKPAPPVQKLYSEDDEIIELVSVDELKTDQKSLSSVLNKRRSRRKFNDKNFTKEELSFLLWAVQGLNSDNKRFRTAPSAGARHPFETYIIVNKVDNIEPGLYRYLFLEHKLLFLKGYGKLKRKFTVACLNQKFTKQSAVDFMWTVIPYRTEWRYGVTSHKVIAMDAGHLCQNLYLASEAFGGGTCAIGAYSQKRMDDLLEVDGEDEFVIYAAVTGKVN